MKTCNNHRSILDLCFRKSQAENSHDNRERCVFKFNTKSRRFQIPLVEERFQKAPFLVRISVDRRPNCRNKAEFFKFFQRSVDGT